MEKTIGRREIISFPDLMVDKIKAKIDTGAYGTALHVDNIEIINDALTFTINNNTFTYTKFKIIKVKSSFGKKQKRFSIFTKIKIGDLTYKIWVSLTNRKNMRYPVLIGRRFLYKFNYLVDVRKNNVNNIKNNPIDIYNWIIEIIDSSTNAEHERVCSRLADLFKTKFMTASNNWTLTNCLYLDILTHINKLEYTK